MEAHPSSKPYLHSKPESGNATTLPIMEPASVYIFYFN